MERGRLERCKIPEAAGTRRPGRIRAAYHRPMRIFWTTVAGALLVAGPVPAQGQDVPDDELYYEIEQIGWDLTDRFRVPGVAVACVRDGAIAWTLGCGYADVASETPVTGDTVFNIGSISKSVAAWRLMQLVESGAVDLDAPVETYLTRWELPPSDEFDSAGVTLRRLLSHTAGLSLHGYPGFEPSQELPTLEASLSGETNGSEDVRLIFEPGTRWKYSGGGYTMAQLLVEESTGADFATSMREKVLLPLGMTSGDYGWTEKVDRAAATPYDGDGEPIGGPRFTALAAAGLQVSARDLARFAIANMPAFRPPGDEEVLSAATVETMLRPAPSSPDYGLGFQVWDHEGIRLNGHGGANTGWMAQLVFASELGAGIVILTNGSNGQRLHGPIETAWRRTLTDAAAAK